MSFRREVLQAFKSLHQARKSVFEGDPRALAEARSKINEEYKKCKPVTESGAIQELIKYSKDVENVLRTTVIQAHEVAPGKFEAKMRDEVIRLDNVPYNECASPSSGSKNSEVK